MLIRVEVKKRVTAQGRMFSLEVDFASESERLVLFGPSGSGKTLTVKAIGGSAAAGCGADNHGGAASFSTKGKISISPPATGISAMSPRITPCSPI